MGQRVVTYFGYALSDDRQIPTLEEIAIFATLAESAGVSKDAAVEVKRVGTSYILYAESSAEVPSDFLTHP